MSANLKQIGGTHYLDRAIQPWDAILDWGCGFLDGNVIKYIARYRDKGGIQDLQKARHYLDKLIEIEQERADEIERYESIHLDRKAGIEQ
jgi:hypothetical protein